MDPLRSAGRPPLPGNPASNSLPTLHNTILTRPNLPGNAQDGLSSNPNSSWHSSRDAGNTNQTGSESQSQSQSQPYSSSYSAGHFDYHLGQMPSQSDLLPSPGGPNNSSSGTQNLNKLDKKRGRDDQDDLDGQDPQGKFLPSPSRIAELTAGFPTPPASNGPPALITTGRMTKTHADPLIAQLINPDGTPKRPMNAFMIFARKRRPEVAADNPNLRTGEISKLLSSEWKTIDNESKQFYLTKAKELKENFTSIFPTYVYKRRPNNSRKRRKTEETGYGGPGAIGAIDRGEGGLSEDEGDMTPPDGLSPPLPHHGGHHHHMGGMGGMPGMGGPPGMPPRRPGDPGSMHLPPHHGGMGVPPPHDLSYGMHGSQYGGPPGPGGGGPPPPHHRNQGSPQMHYDSVPGGSGGGGPGAPGGYGGPRNPGGSWPSLDHPVVKPEPKSSSSSFTSFSSSYRLEGASSSSGGPPHSSGLRIPGGNGPSGPNGSTQGMRNGPSGGSYNFSIPSPNFGPGPGLPPIGRSQGGSNPASASQTPLLGPGGPPSGGGGGGGGGPGSMLPPPTTSGLYGHGSSHPGAAGGHGGHAHAHSGSYFESSWPRTNQSPSTSSLNINGPPGPGNSGSSSGGGPSGGGGGGGPPGSNDRHTPNSRGRSDSLGGGPQSASSNSGQWSL